MSIIERVEKFDFSRIKFQSLKRTDDYSQVFLLKLQIQDFPMQNCRKKLIANPYFCIYSVRLHIEQDKELFTQLEIGLFTENLSFS